MTHPLRYTVVIRTLGKSGVCYERTLRSLMQQTVRPEAIVVYIAEGYPLPPETVGFERYVYVPKGMVAQRALPYTEVETDYMLFLDDDVYLPPAGVETLYRELLAHGGQVISPCVFANHQAPLAAKIRMTLLGREACRPWGGRWAYKVMGNGGFSYRNRPEAGVYPSQTNAGPCFFCRKADFLGIHYADERWLEASPYAFPDDQVMFYKMYCQGLKVLTSFDSGIVHLDASSTVADPVEKARKVVYSEYRNKLIFWHRFLFLPERSGWVRALRTIALGYTYGVQGVKYALLHLLGNKASARAFAQGVRDAVRYLRSAEYAALPPVTRVP